MLRAEDFQAVSASSEDTEGIIDHIREIRDTQVAVFFSEKQGEVRISLRSTGAIDVAKLARAFGGGGHIKAAGITYRGSIDYAVCDVLHAIEAALAAPSA